MASLTKRMLRRNRRRRCWARCCLLSWSVASPMQLTRCVGSVRSSSSAQHACAHHGARSLPTGAWALHEAAPLPSMHVLTTAHVLSPQVRGLCTKQLLQLCKSAGVHMRAHVVALLPALLETLSVIEDPALNYLQMHSESAGIAEGALEAARLTAMRSSDATVAIDACLRVMDADQLEAALPSLIHLLSRGTGLPTRAGRSLGRLEHDAPRQRMQMLTTACKCSLRRRIRSPRRPFSAHLGALFAHHGAPLRRHRSDSGAARTDAATAAAPARGPPAAHIARGLAI